MRAKSVATRTPEAPPVFPQMPLSAAMPHPIMPNAARQICDSTPDKTRRQMSPLEISESAARRSTRYRFQSVASRESRPGPVARPAHHQRLNTVQRPDLRLHQTTRVDAMRRAAMLAACHYMPRHALRASLWR